MLGVRILLRIIVERGKSGKLRVSILRVSTVNQNQGGSTARLSHIPAQNQVNA